MRKLKALLAGAAIVAVLTASAIPVKADHIASITKNALMFIFIAPPSTPPTLTYVTTLASTGNNQVHTFTDAAISTASATRTLIVAVTGRDDLTSFTISGVTSSTNAMDKRASSEDTGSLVVCGIYTIARPTGTTSTIEVTFSEAIMNCGIAIWAAYDLISAVPTDTANTFSTNSSAIDLSLDVSENGVAVGIGACEETNSTTWVGFTERSDMNTENGGGNNTGRISAADYTATSAVTPLTVNTDFTNASDSCGCAASFR